MIRSRIQLARLTKAYSRKRRRVAADQQRQVILFYQAAVAQAQDQSAGQTRH